MGHVATAMTWTATTFIALVLVWVVTVIHTHAAITTYVPSEVLQCVNGKSTQSFCLYRSSCDFPNSLWQINPITARTQIETSGVVKQVTCDGAIVFNMQYIFNSASSSCSYNVSTTSTRLTKFKYGPIPATNIWSNVAGPANQNTLLQQPETSDTTLCAYLSVQASYQCLIPYVSPESLIASGQVQGSLPQFCGLLDTIDMQCGTQFFECQIATSLVDYTCYSASQLVSPPTPGASFYMQCSHVSFATIQACSLDSQSTNSSSYYTSSCPIGKQGGVGCGVYCPYPAFLFFSFLYFFLSFFNWLIDIYDYIL